jgi:hypothetical protein
MRGQTIGWAQASGYSGDTIQRKLRYRAAATGGCSSNGVNKQFRIRGVAFRTDWGTHLI